MKYFKSIVVLTIIVIISSLLWSTQVDATSIDFVDNIRSIGLDDSIYDQQGFNNVTVPLPDVGELAYDLCYVRILTNLTDLYTLNLSSVFGACYNCAFQPLDIVFINGTTPYFTLATTFSYTFNASVYDLIGRMGETITFSTRFHERGIYDLYINSIYVTSTKGLSYNINIVKDPINTFVPIGVMFGIFIGAAIAWPIIIHYYKKSKSESLEFQLQNLESNQPKKDRLKSLDVFRGLSITIMIFVNYGGGGYWFFNHSYWNGLTVADLVFPWFIFIMGIAMPLSFNAMEIRGVPKRTIFIKLVRRSVILFSLGLFINNGNNLGHWRILGVLQRFGVSYFVTGCIMMFVPLYRPNGGGGGNSHHQYNRFDGTGNDREREPSESDPLFQSSSIQEKFKAHSASMLADFIPFWLQWLFALLILAVWFLVTFLLPVPGCPTGYLGPGGLGDQGQHVNCTGGAAKIVDLHIFSNNHIFQTPTCQPIYNTGAYDPEGTLGYLTSVFMCFLGVHAGRTIMTYKSNRSRLIRWTILSILLCGIAAGLCGVSQNGGWIPINKNLWTPSFIFLLSGFGFFVLAIFYVVVDIKRIWNGAPLVYVGMNPITIYCGHEILGGYFPFSFYASVQTHALYLLSNCIGVGCWLLIAYLMYKNRVFINI
ncbi:transmembrane protein [Cavenderia fasciculata]|uniref:Transmembrane protein n=1 Tax=Cavenderia fasciculata TaxID=261658 RepID=F4Q483_CACFS|nr:uncharacterized protein DFA_08785 [Cavenderia fasciculata]EGG17785.1 transmembrane protein [Cavenderia fasciculata]|eukprot:XP_004356269.1 transmembrane protein [Cavenderia fasciculata]